MKYFALLINDDPAHSSMTSSTKKFTINAFLSLGCLKDTLMPYTLVENPHSSSQIECIQCLAPSAIDISSTIHSF